MDELRDMSSKTNSLEGVKEKYKKAIIDNYRERLTILKNMGEIYEEDIKETRRRFDSTQYQNAFDNSLGSNDRWGIVSKKNFFGLSAELFPENGKGIKKDNSLYLRLDSGRFQMQKFPTISSSFFPNAINISDILERSENEQFAEIEEFYNMNNREVFEKYGITALCDNERGGQTNLIANCVIMDSLLQGKYSEMKDVFCWSPAGYVINIKLEDGTEINANSTNLSNDSQAGNRGITIRKEGKEATVDFVAISIGDKLDILTNINDLEIENVVYTGEPELIAQLQQAMQKQFESQRQQDQIQNTTIVPECENYYERYNEMAIKLHDKAGVCSYDEDYELDGLAISCINDGSALCIKSDTLGIVFLIDDKMCIFHDSDNLVKIDYHSNEEYSPSMEEYLSHLEQIGPQNKEIVGKMKEFTKKLEELAIDEKTNEETTHEEVATQTANDLLLTRIINGGVKESDVKSFQQTLIKAVEQPNKKTNLDENKFRDYEGK